MVLGFPSELVAALRPRYRLEWHGIHGWSHWVRVGENGLRLAALTGADPAVVAAFALVHDIERCNDDFDPGHGPRAALVVDELGPELLPLGETQRELLRVACRLHTDGLTEGEVTVQTCWDADRLDLGRVGIRPHPERLCTTAARSPELLAWAWRRSLDG